MPVRHFWVPQNTVRAYALCGFFAPPQFASPANLRFAYSGCQTVANLKRYMPFVQNGIDKTR